MIDWMVNGTMTTDESSETDEEDEDSEPFPEERVLELEFENAKKRLVEQRETLREFSQEGAKYFRLLLLFIGVPLAILGTLDPDTLFQISSSVTSERCIVTFPIDCFSANRITIVTGILLISSILTNILAGGFEARGIHNSSNPSDLHQTINSEKSASEHLRSRLEDYRDRIEHNDRVIHTEESLLMAGKFSLLAAVYGVGTLAYGLAAGITIQFESWVSVLIILLAIVLLTFMYLPSDYINSDQFIRFSPLYDTAYKSDLDQSDSNSETKGNSDSSEGS